MKKVLLTSVVVGLFLAGCGESLPKEITEHANFKSCQQVEKNLLTIQSSFEKDEKEIFYKQCNENYNRQMIYKEIFDGGEDFLRMKDLLLNKFHKKFNSIKKAIDEYNDIKFIDVQMNKGFDTSKWLED